MSEKTLKLIKDNDVKWVDLRFTDSHGKEQHVTIPVGEIDEDFFQDGKMFDGSSIAGWKGINESDMILMPDPASAVVDPFTAQPCLILFCDVIEPATGQGYERCPRSTAKRALAYMQSAGIGDTAYFGAEPEFFLFDDVRWTTSQDSMAYALDSEEGPYNTGTEFEGGNRGHRPGPKGGYFPVPPVDSANDIRAEMVNYINEMGVRCEKHHHEVAPSQHELGDRKSVV